MTGATAALNLLWLQSGGCGGCTLSLMCAESPDLVTTLRSANINVLWHPSLSESCGQDFNTMLDEICKGDVQLDVLCLEGSVMRGPNGSGRFHLMAGSGKPMMDVVAQLAGHARYVLAIGSCAAYGGITSAGENHVEACGLQYDGTEQGGLLGADFCSAAGLPVINIAGCPIHPNWFSETLLQLGAAQFGEQDLDEYRRPRTYTDHLVHHGCPRNEYYEFKASASKSADLGCLMENMGCLGTQARADCNTRLWNGEGSCLRGGYACINCTAPGFEEPGHVFMETPKIAGIPIGLPTDMPKAWFVALASLAKAATPRRLKENASSDHIRVSPSGGNKDK